MVWEAKLEIPLDSPPKPTQLSLPSVTSTTEALLHFLSRGKTIKKLKI
jgi:hypothetical protein